MKSWPLMPIIFAYVRMQNLTLVCGRSIALLGQVNFPAADAPRDTVLVTAILVGESTPCFRQLIPLDRRSYTD